MFKIVPRNQIICLWKVLYQNSTVTDFVMFGIFTESENILKELSSNIVKIRKRDFKEFESSFWQVTILKWLSKALRH